MNRRTSLLVAVALILGGCQLYRVRPGAETWREQVKTIGILSAIRVEEVSPGGVVEVNADGTAKAARMVVKVLGDGLKARQLKSKPLSWERDPELDDVRLLYAEVASAIWRYTYPPYPFPPKQKQFDYTVGPIGGILDRAGVDVLLVAAGSGKTDANGRPLWTLGGQSFTILTLGLIDRKGDVVWFDVAGGRAVDLRSEVDVQQTVNKLLSELPGAGR
jgi:hypothetical protein